MSENIGRTLAPRRRQDICHHLTKEPVTATVNEAKNSADHAKGKLLEVAGRVTGGLTRLRARAVGHRVALSAFGRRGRRP